MMSSQNLDEENLQTILFSDDDGGDGGVSGGADDESPSGSHSNYKNTLTSSSSFHHPLATTDEDDGDDFISVSNYQTTNDGGDGDGDALNTANSDPLFSPPPPCGDDSGDPPPLSPAILPPAPVKSDYLRISVSDPKKETESNNSFVTYLITTETDLLDYKGSKFAVRRRFRDVVTLSDRLGEAYRGFFVPARPDKSLVEGQVMQKQEFVEQRRVAVERYLRRLARHAVIRRSEELRVFLVVEGRLMLGRGNDIGLESVRGESRVRGGDVMQSVKRGGDWRRLFREVKQRSFWGGAKAVMEEKDMEFLEKKEKLSQLERQLKNASKQAESLVKAQKKMGETFGELGLAFLKLTKFENEQATSVAQKNRATDLKSIATSTVKAGRFHRGLSAQCVKHLDTLHEYMGLMLAVNHAFSDRSSALLTARTLISELSSLRAKAEKLETASSKNFGGDKPRPGKMEELNEAIRVTEDSKDTALREYERIKENNRSEIERLDRERKADFMNMLKGFVSNQVAYAEKIETEWAKVAQETSRYTKESG